MKNLNLNPASNAICFTDGAILDAPISFSPLVITGVTNFNSKPINQGRVLFDSLGLNSTFGVASPIYTSSQILTGKAYDPIGFVIGAAYNNGSLANAGTIVFNPVELKSNFGGASPVNVSSRFLTGSPFDMVSLATGATNDNGSLANAGTIVFNPMGLNSTFGGTSPVYTSSQVLTGKAYDMVGLDTGEAYNNGSLANVNTIVFDPVGLNSTFGGASPVNISSRFLTGSAYNIVSLATSAAYDKVSFINQGNALFDPLGLNSTFAGASPFLLSNRLTDATGYDKFGIASVKNNLQIIQGASINTYPSKNQYQRHHSEELISCIDLDNISFSSKEDFRASVENSVCRALSQLGSSVTLSNVTLIFSLNVFNNPISGTNVHIGHNFNYILKNNE